MDLNAVIGPFGALVLAVLALAAFVKEIVTPGSRTRRAEKLASDAIAGWQAEQVTTAAFAKALEGRNTIERRRQTLAKQRGGS